MQKPIKKIALINPRRSLTGGSQAIQDMFEKNRDYLKLWYSPPLSLLVIASLTPEKYEVILIDEHFESIDFEADYDLIGITAMTQQANRAYEIANEFRARNKYVVMGGIHATILSEEALNHVDSVFVGEAEELWVPFLNDLENGIENRIYKSDKLFNLTEATTPSYKLVNFEHFNAANNYFRFMPVQATRGCPHDCSFCVTSKFYGRHIREKKIDQIIKEIIFLKECSNNSLILFVDDNLFVDRKYARQLLIELIPLKIKYIAQSDIRIANDSELLKLAYLSGCTMVFIGLESIDEHSINHVNENSWKMKQVKHYADSIKIIQENGIVVFGAFVIGFENDNLSTFDHIHDFVIENKIPAQFTLLTPLPGTREYENMEKEGLLINKLFWDKCSFFNLTFHHKNFNPTEAENKIIWLHNEIFNEENSVKRNLHMVKIYKNLPQRWKL